RGRDLRGRRRPDPQPWPGGADAERRRVPDHHRAQPMTYHASTTTRRHDRRIMGGPGARANLCGAALTAYDATPRDFTRSARGGFVAPTGATACPACRALTDQRTR